MKIEFYLSFVQTKQIKSHHVRFLSSDIKPHMVWNFQRLLLIFYYGDLKIWYSHKQNYPSPQHLRKACKNVVTNHEVFWAFWTNLHSLRNVIHNIHAQWIYVQNYIALLNQ